MNRLNADVRWTSACRQLDGGNTLIILSGGKNNVPNLAGICRNERSLQRTSERMSFLFWRNQGRTDLNHLNADVRWTSACRQLDGGNTLVFLSSGKKNTPNLAGICRNKRSLQKDIRKDVFFIGKFLDLFCSRLHSATSKIFFAVPSGK